jgi:hypothetical protein
VLANHKGNVLFMAALKKQVILKNSAFKPFEAVQGKITER